jgi:hypothetical protein
MSHETITFIDEMDKDDEWLKAHLDEIVDRYARQVIAVLDQEIVAVGDTISAVGQMVAAHHPARIPLLFEVPSREEFVCLLSSINTPS